MLSQRKRLRRDFRRHAPDAPAVGLCKLDAEILLNRRDALVFALELQTHDNLTTPPPLERPVFEYHCAVDVLRSSLFVSTTRPAAPRQETNHAYTFQFPLPGTRRFQTLPARRQPHSNNLVREKAMPARRGREIHSLDVLGEELELGETVGVGPVVGCVDAVLVDPEALVRVQVLRDGGVEQADLRGADVWSWGFGGDGEGLYGLVWAVAAVEEVFLGVDCD